MMAKGNILKHDKILAKNVHEVHVYLAHRSDKQNLKALLRKGKNVTQI